ncbi:MAG: glycosyltransferase family 2 protein [Proteobacteria bacterium]|nr:glycosyltransferase family 2 protein [Pseudomonadota bacterium]
MLAAVGAWAPHDKCLPPSREQMKNGRKKHNRGYILGRMTAAAKTPAKALTSSWNAPAEGVSVVVVSYWTGPVLFAAIEAVLAQDQEGVVELIMVDNGNPPAVTKELARRAKTEPRLRLVSGHGNIGFTRGCNIGARRAVGRYLLLLNPDCCLGPGAIPALLAEASVLGDHWMLGCRVVNPDGSEQRGSRRALLTPYTALVEAFRLDMLAPRLFRRHRLNHHDDPPPNGTVRIPAISGACMMLPAATFHAMGGLDEGYFLHVDDLDLCLRLDRAEIPVYYAPHVEVVHHVSSSGANPVLVEWHKTRGFLRYFWTHFRGPLWFLLWGPLSIGVLARFGIKAMRLLLHSVWQQLFPSSHPPPHSPPNKNGEHGRTHIQAINHD